MNREDQLRTPSSLRRADRMSVEQALERNMLVAEQPIGSLQLSISDHRVRQRGIRLRRHAARDRLRPRNATRIAQVRATEILQHSVDRGALKAFGHDRVGSRPSDASRRKLAN